MPKDQSIPYAKHAKWNQHTTALASNEAEKQREEQHWQDDDFEKRRRTKQQQFSPQFIAVPDTGQKSSSDP